MQAGPHCRCACLGACGTVGHGLSSTCCLIMHSGCSTSLQSFLQGWLQGLQSADQLVAVCTSAEQLACAGRDYKGLGFLLLLPIASIALVMLILTVNIDPSSPTMTLRLESMLDSPTITVAATPPSLAACLQASGGAGPSNCTGGHTFLEAPNITDSLGMSTLLLEVLALLSLWEMVSWCCIGDHTSWLSTRFKVYSSSSKASAVVIHVMLCRTAMRTWRPPMLPWCSTIPRSTSWQLQPSLMALTCLGRPSAAQQRLLAHLDSFLQGWLDSLPVS